MSGSEGETIRWPTNLDRKAIEERLASVSGRAAQLNLKDISERFADVKALPAAQIASRVVATLTFLFNQPQAERARYEDIARDLEMVALNLKNLK